MKIDFVKQEAFGTPRRAIDTLHWIADSIEHEMCTMRGVHVQKTNCPDGTVRTTVLFTLVEMIPTK